MHGIAAAKAGERREARRYLEWALRIDCDHDQEIEARFWLSEVSQDRAEKRALLETILATNPNEMRARRKLALLDGRLQAEDLVDPDRMAPGSDGAPQVAAAQRFTCPRCGGRMSYTPDGQSLTCEYCALQESLEAGREDRPAQPGLEEEDFVLALATARGHRHLVPQRTSVCQGCGAAFLFTPEHMTSVCPYCGSNYVEESQARNLVAPTGLAPFRVTAAQARDVLKTWLLGQAAPRQLRVQRGTKVYLPAWTFDIGGSVQLRFRVQKGRNWEQVTRDRPIFHNDILVPAARRLPPELQQALEAYDLAQLVPYDPRYLAGCIAETYQLSPAQASLEARQVALERERQVGVGGIFTPERDVTCSSAGMAVESFKLILLPVWVAALYLGKERRLALIHGQNGRLCAQSLS
ncbi:MAG: hypothetical protein GYA17_09265 [Chloroflexi bacterium]|nr:hypothetical protein [Chloroflexota bacterium]